MSVLLQPDPQSLDQVFNWYLAAAESFGHHRSATLAALRVGGAAEARFTGMTAGDVDAHFDAQRRNLDRLTILNMVATAEAAVRADYRRRVDAKRKDRLSKAYRAFHGGLSNAQRLRPPFDEQGILHALKGAGVMHPHLVADFRNALRLRHWIAHGRYWTQPLARNTYAPDDVHRIILALLTALP